MDLVEPALDREPRGLHRRFVGVGGNADEVADDDDRAPERLAEPGAVPGVEIERAGS